MRKGKIICIDIETTGLDPANDEILQISIINGRGKTLYNSYIRPVHKREWKEAEEINKISWEAVKNARHCSTKNGKMCGQPYIAFTRCGGKYERENKGIL